MGNTENDDNQHLLRQVDAFVQDESRSRFEPGLYPLDLLNWESRVEWAQVQAQRDEDLPEVMRVISDGREPHVENPRDKRAEMTERLWDRLDRFYRKNGYEALERRVQSLEKRREDEREHATKMNDRCNYATLLSLACRAGAEKYGGDTRITESPGKGNVQLGEKGGMRCVVKYSGPDENLHVSTQIRISEGFLDSQYVDRESLDEWPYELESDRTWSEALNQVEAYSEKMTARSESTRSLIHLLQLQASLAKQMLWQIDAAGQVVESPTPYSVTEQLNGRRTPVRQCLMILRLTDGLDLPAPTISEPAEIVERCFERDELRRDDRDTSPKSFVEGAATLVRELSDTYEKFHRHFLDELNRLERPLKEAAEKMGVDDIPEPNCVD